MSACSSDRWRLGSQGYTVRKNETLFAIAWRYKLDYKELARWNNISSPYTIYPGQQLFLVEPDGLQSNNKPQASPAQASRNTTKPSLKARDTGKRPVLAKTTPKQWRWPADGKIVARFRGSNSTSTGIDIAGKFGQPVKATAAGKVVYSGSGLKGYGNLLIIKHSDEYLSAYGHNSELLVREGDAVISGQKIAKMGFSESRLARLHFEIRRQGAPVDPLKHLPKR